MFNFFKIKIVDNDNNVIGSGKIKKVKNSSSPVFFKDLNDKLVSLDGKRFFHMRGTAKYKIIQDENSAEINIREDLIKNFSHEKWMNYRNISDPDVIDYFIENTIFELDKPIEPLIILMNNINGIVTEGSCCGHNIGTAYIQIQFDSRIIDTFTKFLLILSDIKFKLYNDWIFVFNHLLCDISNFDIIKNDEYKLFAIELRAKSVGYKPIEKLLLALEYYLQTGFLTMKKV